MIAMITFTAPHPGWRTDSFDAFHSGPRSHDHWNLYCHQRLASEDCDIFALDTARWVMIIQHLIHRLRLPILSKAAQERVDDIEASFAAGKRGTGIIIRIDLDGLLNESKRGMNGV